ncbi:hypothetical protein IW150_003890 [Coemansia sp. RSA 2607]|nr:hypothetical protein IW150_003890 [Coemansia sp. RSA 2607]
MSPIDLQSAAACFSEVTVSNRRSQECRLYDKLCVTYKDSTPDKWPPAANPPRYADIAFLDDSGNVVLRRKPNKEIHSTYITLVGAVPDYDKDEIIRVAKEKVKEHVDIFATAYNEEQENPPAQDPDPEPVTPLEINQMVDSVMDHVMSSVLNTHVDTGEGNGESMGDGGGSDQEMS